MNRFAQKRTAFTLIETMMVVALTAVLTLVLGALIYSFNNLSSYEQASIQSSGSASAVLREIESLVFPASAVLETHAFSAGTRTSTASSLVLQIPSIDASGAVIANTYDYAAFYLTGTDAYRLLEADALSSRISGTKRLGSSVETLIFSYNSPTFSQVSTTSAQVSVEKVVKGNTLSDQVSAQLRLRNF